MNITEEQLYNEIRTITNTYKNIRYILEEDREDVMIDIYVKCLDKLRDGTIDGDWDNMKNYCYIVGLNHVRTLNHKITKMRDNINSNIEVDNDSFINNAGTYDTTKDIDNKDLYDVIMNNITDEGTKKIFQLRFEGYTFDAIGVQCNIHPLVIKGRYYYESGKIRKEYPELITTRRIRKH